MFTVDSESRYGRFFFTNDIRRDALVSSLIGLLDIGYHKISTIHEGNSAEKKRGKRSCI